LLACYFGVSLFNLIPFLAENGLVSNVLVGINQVVQLLAGIAGLTYLIFRIADLFLSIQNKKISNKLDNKIKFEEGVKMERDNFYKNFNNEFNK